MNPERKLEYFSFGYYIFQNVSLSLYVLNKSIIIISNYNTTNCVDIMCPSQC